MQVGVDVVFDHQHTVTPAQLQHLLRHHRRQIAARRVVIKAVDEQRSRLVLLEQCLEHLDIRPAWRTRDFDHRHPLQPEQLEQLGVAGAFDHHAVPWLEQDPCDQVQTLAGPGGGHDALIICSNAQLIQALANLPTQCWQPQWRTVVEQARHVGAADLANRVRQIIRLPPAFGEPTAPQGQLTRRRLQLHTLEPGVTCNG
ncbi:hypothetical protein D3C73_959590 [compost metagenome]